MKSFLGGNNSLEGRFWIFLSFSIWSGRIKRVDSFDYLGFGLVGIQKGKKFLPTFFFFFAFLSCQNGFTNYLDILIFLFLISYQEKFQAVKYPSKISTSRNIKLKNCRIQFIGLFGWFFLNFAPKTFCTLKMFLLKGPHNFVLYWIHM